ncbi:unnamed protein product [Psylliodes chrysocephalus]|uniref:THAP-type domain-containing protein n=1 Tax=Psylliodes chrysocephalus TaxID=3402493 RepID=A0A9P0DDH5_9CUCU|nr:unnamed protein product [Psylliodes chrysocephala]
MNNLTKTVHQCCVCHKSSRHEKRTLSFFRFPKDEKRFAEWKAVLQLEKFASFSAKYCYEHFRICSNHFEDKMFAGMGKNRLKKDAVPKQLPRPDRKSLFLESVGEPEPVASTSQKHISTEFEKYLTDYPGISNIVHVDVTRIKQED